MFWAGKGSQQTIPKCPTGHKPPAYLGLHSLFAYHWWKFGDWILKTRTYLCIFFVMTLILETLAWLFTVSFCTVFPAFGQEKALCPAYQNDLFCLKFFSANPFCVCVQIYRKDKYWRYMLKKLVNSLFALFHYIIPWATSQSIILSVSTANREKHNKN